MLKNARVIVTLVGDAKEEYLRLKAEVGSERARGSSPSFHQTLLRSLEAKFGLLKEHYDLGVHVPRKLIPKEYLERYGVTNLWKLNLSGYWRMLYTLRQPARGEIALEVFDVYVDVLDILDHKRYDKLFGYHER